jgi:hypothetical protein
MSIFATNLDHGSPSGVSTIITNSVTIAPNALVLVSVAAADSTSLPTVTSITGAGQTWTLVATETDSTPDVMVAVFRALGTGGSGALTITLSATPQQGSGYSVDQFTGVLTSGTNGSGAVHQAIAANDGGTAVPTPTITLSTLQTGSVTFGAFGAGTFNSISAGSGYSLLSHPGANVVDFLTEVDLAGSTTVSINTSTGNTTFAGVAIEIAKALASAGGLFNHSIPFA